MDPKKQKETITGKALDDLVNQCLVVTDRNGRILGRSSSKVISFLSMKYQSDYGEINFAVTVAAMGNGSYRVEVKDGIKTLLKAHGNYTSGPYNSSAEEYISGDWEDKLKREYQAIKKQ